MAPKSAPADRCFRGEDVNGSPDSVAVVEMAPVYTPEARTSRWAEKHTGSPDVVVAVVVAKGCMPAARQRRHEGGDGFWLHGDGSWLHATSHRRCLRGGGDGGGLRTGSHDAAVFMVLEMSSDCGPA